MSKAADNFLAHYGVLGMHWGTRKADDSLFRVPKVTDKGKKLTSARKEVLTNRAKSQSDRIAVNGGASEEEVKKGWSRGRKIALGIGIGLGVAGVGLGAAYLVKSGKGKALLSSIGMGDKLGGVPGASNKIKSEAFMENYMNRSGDVAEHFMDSDISELDDTDIHFPAGSEFKRITTNGNEPLTDRLYTSFTDADHDRYKAIYADVLKQRTDAKELFTSTMKVKEELRSPSEKKRVQALVDVIKEHGDDMFDSGYGEKASLHDQLMMLSPDALDLLDENSDDDGRYTGPKIAPEILARDGYKAVAGSLAFKAPLSDLYLDKIRSMGYNALIDDNDYKQLSDLPVIILNPDKVVSSRSSTLLTQAEIDAAKDRLTDLIDD